jgi:hypothetical protein
MVSAGPSLDYATVLNIVGAQARAKTAINELLSE